MEVPKRLACWLLLCLIFAAIGCRRISDHEKQRSLRTQAAYYGRLERTSQTRHTSLREELARLAGEEAMPTQLTATRIESPRDGGPGWRRPGRRILDQDNVAAALVEALSQVDQAAFRRELDRIYPSGMTSADHGAAPRVRRFLARHASVTAACRAALTKTQCELGIQYTEGLAADLTVVDIFLRVSQLFGLEALAALADQETSPAVDYISDMFRLARLLGDEPHLTVRVASARIREDALRVLQAVAQDTITTEADLSRLAELLQQTLDDWPADHWAWLGERAIGLHAYEMVRRGELLALMSYKELAGYDQKGLAALCREVEFHVDDDQMYFLSAMRRIIAACKQPYCERRGVIEELQMELAGGHRPELKRFIAHLLLADELDWGQQVQARDRALCEGWLLALATALNRNRPVGVNPLTGKPYSVLVQDAMVYVTGVDMAGGRWRRFDEPLSVRLPSKGVVQPR